MYLLLAAAALLIGGGLICLLFARHNALISWIGPGAPVLAAVLGTVPAIQAVFGHGGWAVRWAWSIPFGSLALELDALSGWFILPILLIGAAAAIYGAEYLKNSSRQRSLGSSWFFYNLLLASMIVLVLARNGVLFLIAWEVMSVTSFFLVMFEDDKPEVRRAGWTYLVATHLGTSFLLGMFVLAGQGAGDLDFVNFAGGANSSLLFVLAVIGFGTKAGFVPMHVWLPEAHPAAPSHASAIMSGVMIKMGVYGLLRTLTLIGPPQAWWAWLLIFMGLVSGLVAIIFALAQHDLKRLLAYSSVENVGIITLALGMGLMGVVRGSSVLTALGLAGALLHVLNHSLFKSLLFMGAGAVLHGTGTACMNSLGGLARRMPWTAGGFLLGAAAICALPPLNGFCGELLIYLAALRTEQTAGTGVVVAGVCIVGTLGLVGGLTVAAFVKAFGSCFLGEPRSRVTAQAHEPNWGMRGPIIGLAVACVLAAILSPVLVAHMGPVMRGVAGPERQALQEQLDWASQMLTWVMGIGLAFMVLAALLAALRARLLSGRQTRQVVTWDCGYAEPTPRMQYTAASFTQPLTALFATLLRSRMTSKMSAGLFPQRASFSSDTPDLLQEHVFIPGLTAGERLLARARWLQHGNVQLYVLYIAWALLAVLVWELW